MKPRRRIRSLVKRTGVAVTALLLIVGVASMCYCFKVALWPTIGLCAWGGQLQIAWREPWSIDPRKMEWVGSVGQILEPHLLLWFEYFAPRSPAPGVGIPFWFLILLTGVPTLLMFRADRRRALLGNCPNCGYSRIGLAADRPCPECGTAVQTQNGFTLERSR